MINPRLTFAIYLLAAGAAALLYRTSYAVDELHSKIANSERQIVAEQQNIQVLGAEWTYLTEPTRIEALAAKYLHLEATKAQRVAGMGDMHRVIAAPTQTASPVAAVAAAAPVQAATPVARMLAAAQASEQAKLAAQAAPVQTAQVQLAQSPAQAPAARAASPLLATASLHTAPAQRTAQPTTPNSVKLLLASFQSGQPGKLTRE